MSAASTRREELLAIAGRLFAERGFAQTTVRDIADAAGILSGSLYYHFDSKESMVDELLDSFQTSLWASYDEITASSASPREKLEAVVRASFEAIASHPSEVAIYQNDAGFLMGLERFDYLRKRHDKFRRLWLGLLRDGIAAGELREDLDVELAYRFLCDTVWVAVRWYRPRMKPAVIADHYLRMVLEGIARG